MSKLTFVLILLGCLLAQAMSAQTLTKDTAKANILFDQASKLQEAGQLTKLDSVLRLIIPLYARHQLWEKEIEIHDFINKNYYELGHKDSCLVMYANLIKYTEQKLGRISKPMAKVYLDAAVHYVRMYKLDEALTLFQQAEEIGDKTYKLPSPFLGRLYSTMGVCYVRIGDTHKAIDYYLNARKKYGKLLTPNNAYYVNSNLVSAYFQIGDKKAAMREAITFMILMQKKAEDQPYLLAEAYRNVGLVSYMGQNYNGAVKYFTQTINTLEKYNPNEKDKIADAYSDLGTIYKDSYYHIDENDDLARQECLDSAVRNIQKAIVLKEKLHGKKDINIAVTYRSLGYIHMDLQKNKEKALEAFHNAMLATLPLETKTNLLYVPNLSTGRVVFPDYKEFFGAVEAKTHALRALYDDTKKAKYLDALLEHINVADKILTQQLRRTSNVNDQKTVMSRTRTVADWALRSYYLAYEDRNDIKYLEKAFEYSENSKSIQLLAALQTSESSQLGGLPEAIQNKEKELQQKIDELTVALIDASKDKKDQIEQLEEELFDANQIYDNFIQSLAKDYPSYFNLRYNRKVKTVKELQAELLDKESVLLEYFVADHYVYLFKIGQNSFELLRQELDKDKAIEKIKDFYKTFDVPSESSLAVFKAFVNGAYYMYNDLLQLNTINPKETKHLIIVPDGLLSYLPFELLINELPKDTTQVNYGQLSYLLKDYSMQYSYTASLLLNKTVKPAYNRVLGIAASYDSSLISTSATLRSPDITQLRTNLQPLKGATDEVKYLQQLYSGDYYLGGAATEGQFKNIDFGQYGIIHLAMHGVMNKDNPMASSLAFTENSDSTEDNFLHVYEITYMNIPVEMVVLSACETGYGKFEDGEGVKSVARSFMYAGAASVLMTMWEVHDMAMSEIMEDFYENLEKGLSKSAAIQQAKLNYLENAKGIAAHPFFWAPAIILGNDRPIVPAQPMSWWWMSGALGLAVLGLGLAWGLVKRSNRKKEKIA